MNVRLSVWALAVLLACAAAACADTDRNAADCVNDASVRLGASEGSQSTTTCAVLESIVLIAMPAASRAASESDLIPKEIRLLMTQSRGDGYNWCAFPRNELSALIATGRSSTLRYVCRRVLAELTGYFVTAGRTFRIELRRGASGSAEIIGIKGDAEFKSEK